eukprot:bmy_19799T0
MSPRTTPLTLHFLSPHLTETGGLSLEGLLLRPWFPQSHGQPLTLSFAAQGNRQGYGAASSTSSSVKTACRKDHWTSGTGPGGSAAGIGEQPEGGGSAPVSALSRLKGAPTAGGTYGASSGALTTSQTQRQSQPSLRQEGRGRSPAGCGEPSEMAAPLTGTSTSDAQGAHSKDRRGQVCMSRNERVWEALPSSRRRRQSSGRLHHGLDPSPAPLLTLCTDAAHRPPRQPQPLQDQPEGNTAILIISGAWAEDEAITVPSTMAVGAVTHGDNVHTWDLEKMDPRVCSGDDLGERSPGGHRRSLWGLWDGEWAGG